MEPVLTQVESVMSNKYHEGFQSTLGMAIPLGRLPKWVRNNMDIGDEEIETAYTKFTEVISVNTDVEKNYLCLVANMMDNIGKLENAFSENKRNKTKKKLGHDKRQGISRNMVETHV
jgi:outer membrane biogenesis lipoprotein LolB